MDKIILYLAVTLIFLPTDLGTSKVIKADDKYELMTNEAVIALINLSDSSNVPTPPSPIPVNCKCNGTGREKSGDGLIDMPCSCQPNCRCKRTQEIPTTTIEKPKTVVQKKIYYITSNNCIFCVKFDRLEVPELKSKGWGVDDNPKSCIQKVNMSIDPTIYDKYGKDRGLPLFIYLEDGVEKNAIEGYTSAYNVSKLWVQ